MELSELNTFKPSCENYNMFHIIDQIQYSMILMILSIFVLMLT